MVGLSQPGCLTPEQIENYRNCSHLFPLKNSNQSGSPEATLARTLIPIQGEEKKKEQQRKKKKKRKT